VRPTVLVFVFLLCLYLLSGGGQGYSVDGTFSYEVARSVATDPAREFLSRNRSTLARWGPVVPALGVPFAWAGDRLGRLLPPRESVPLDGRPVPLRDWPALGPDGAGGAVPELLLPLDAPRAAVALRIVSFLSLATSLEQGTPVAEVLALGDPAGLPLARGVLRAGVDSAEWAYDLPLAGHAGHQRAPLAGYWAGNPGANLYVSRVALVSEGGAGATPVRALLVRYLAPAGRLHLRAVGVQAPAAGGAAGAVTEVAGPSAGAAGDQAATFARFGFSFLNAPIVALTAALLVPLAALLGYGRRPAVAVALVYGVATLAWPYAKHDFAEPAAGLFAVAATVLAYAARARAGAGGRRALGAALLLLGLAGALAAAGAGAKYTAAWFVPLLALQVLLLWGRRAAAPLAVFLAPAVLGGGAVLLATGRSPALWAGWRQGIASGWLDFAVTDGLYGLLLSPGKSLFLYAPPLLLSLAGLPLFVRAGGWRRFVLVATPLVYLLVYGSKGVWHGGGWGPRYLVPALPFLVLWSLPVWEAVLRPAPGRLRVALRAVAAVVVVAGIGVQALGVAKHPNRYTVMFRDHVLPGLPDYGVAYGGAPARAYWRHFGGPEAGRQLDRPPLPPAPEGGAPAGAPAPATEGDAPRGLGYAYAEDGSLTLRFEAVRPASYAATVYACDWDHRGRRERLTVTDGAGRREHLLGADFSDCGYLTWPVSAAPGAPLEIRVDRLDPLGGDVPVLSAVFFDPPRSLPGDGPAQDGATGGAWNGRYGADGYVLFGWRRGGVDVGRLPPALSAYAGGDRVWLDTGEAELADTAVLYAPAFSPLLGHAWLLAGDLTAFLFPHNAAVQQRVLASPPWRYLAGLELQPPHPEYGLGLDFWPVLLRDGFRSYPAVMVATWAVCVALVLGVILAAFGLWRELSPPLPAPSRPAPSGATPRIAARPLEGGA
jgi:hypothetical protein